MANIMSNLPQQNTIIQYQGDGTTTTYVYNYYVPLPTDINVYVTLAGELPFPPSNIKILNVDYSVTPNADVSTGGYITFLPGKIPANGSTVTLSRDVKASLDVEFSNATTLNGNNLDEAFERLLLLIQQNKTLINSTQQRVISYQVNAFQASSNITANTQIPVLGLNQIWKGQGTGVIATTLTEGPDSSTLRSDLAVQTVGVDGSRLVGYYDAVNTSPTTVQAFLANIVPFIRSQLSLTLIASGTMFDYAGTTAPAGYLVCDGTAYSRTTYATLFAAIGTVWGVGDGSTTFNVPDLRRRTSVGSGGTGTGVLPNAVGSVGGEETHLLTIDEMPSHDHDLQPYTDSTAASGGGVGAFTNTGTITTEPTGGGLVHNNMQPSAVVLKIIKI